MVYWTNWLVLGIGVVTAVVQAVRGKRAQSMSLLFFEFAGVLIAAVGATALNHVLTRSAGLSGPWLLPVLFVVLGVPLMFLAKAAASAVSWSYESGSVVLGLFWGLALGWVLAHMVLRVMIGFQGPESEVALMLDRGPVTREVYLFHTWNAVLKKLFNVNLGPKV